MNTTSPAFLPYKMKPSQVLETLGGEQNKRVAKAAKIIGIGPSPYLMLEGDKEPYKAPDWIDHELKIGDYIGDDGEEFADTAEEFEKKWERLPTVVAENKVYMSDLTIQIGNSDNKLTQVEWSLYIKDMDALIRAHTRTVHFSGGSSGDKPWQNWCWFCTHNLPPEVLEFFLSQVTEVRKKYHQNSVAVTIGDTKFI